jgi:hypothetical protein
MSCHWTTGTFVQTWAMFRGEVSGSRLALLTPTEMDVWTRERRLGIVVVSLVLAGCSTNLESNASACRFIYDEKVKTEIVLPEFRTKEGRFTENFDLDHPGIVTAKRRVELVFRLKRIVMDPPNFIIAIDPCTSKVIESGETVPFEVTR